MFEDYPPEMTDVDTSMIHIWISFLRQVFDKNCKQSQERIFGVFLKCLRMNAEADRGEAFSTVPGL